ncbi:hypothetical protein SAMN04489724_2497 [Algoriphagus locisalis]|uniref:Addiction module component n=1 Tax=Algoriphagus locisalis TaxID=305507 RepID=A0A1I7BKH4_9BACT|nr:hypothetical protein [Algoriphagus locisalis]SFT87679.1 hypothetical protein SAMN04489724_2497 [Algoriphagus locisalis]
MDLQTRKIEFIQEFLKLQSEEVILRLEKILWKEKSVSSKNEIDTMTIEEFNRRIDKSMDDSENGRIIKDNELKAKIEKWT